ncbi:MAG: hypothetical protein LC775_14190 [Acidobacteria bacterium]|nr:hypothetical protein [Acidobacteriota bacterium]
MDSKGWRLVRAALVKIGDEAAPRIGNLQLGSAEVVRTCEISIKGKAAGAVCIASVPLELTPDNDLTELLRGQARHDAEEALEFTARLSAIEERTTHELSSPDPFIGLTSDNLDDLAQLDGQPIAIEPGLLRVRAELAGSSMNILGKVDMSAFRDRPEGVALLAEALNTSSPLGRYSQLVRLFESAFHLGPKNLTEPFVNFLSSSEHWFKPEEVRQWMKARGPAIHADRRDTIYLDSDVRPFERRMLEAGYDLLLNKAKWRNMSSDRRNIWMAPSGTRGANDERMFMQLQQRSVTARVDFFDGFMAYPMVDAKVPFARALPRAAWLTGGSGDGKLKVMGEWKDQACSDDASGA